jgi:cytochrome b subunit of formate dehydrogenase
MTFSLVSLIVTGLALYSPSLFDPVSMAISNFPIHSNILLLVDVHVAAATAFILLLLLHAAWDLRTPGAGSMIKSRLGDLAELSSRMRGFISGSQRVTRTEKYDAFMKGFHTFLIVAAVGLVITGAVQFYIAPWWTYPQLLHSAIEPWWRPTWIHDALGFSLIALAVAHTYFASLRVNRPILKSMVMGGLGDEVAERQARQ